MITLCQDKAKYKIACFFHQQSLYLQQKAESNVGIDKNEKHFHD